MHRDYYNSINRAPPFVFLPQDCRNALALELTSEESFQAALETRITEEKTFLTSVSESTAVVDEELSELEAAMEVVLKRKEENAVFIRDVVELRRGSFQSDMASMATRRLVLEERKK